MAKGGGVGIAVELARGAKAAVVGDGAGSAEAARTLLVAQIERAALTTNTDPSETSR